MKRLYTLLFLLPSLNSTAATYFGNSGNYTTFLPTLVAGDTLLLQNGNYTNYLVLNNKNGTSTDPIVIIGASQAGVIFLGNACCNTVSITQCSYIVLKNFTINGQNIPGIDAVKAEGTNGNWAHHITIERLKIIGHGGDQQTVGISTKCTCWDWIIRRNVIDAAGTGMYLGNSNFLSPFVNGIIEGNVIKNTVGYNIEIKQENDNLRTITGMTLNGKTIIRYNVFTKESNASTGGNARPCLLVDPYPLNGNGSNDYYEIYNNFFYENPVEALFQGTGHIVMYNNVMVNHQSGGWGVQIRDHNAVQPRNVKVFHNTIVVNSGTGLNFNNCNTSFQQYAIANAIFASPAINSNTTITNTDNVTNTYTNSVNYLNSPLSSIPLLNAFPLTGQLTGTLTSNTLFNMYSNYANDFNSATYNWIYRGAYSGSGTNPCWPLQIDTMPMSQNCITGVHGSTLPTTNSLNVYPNPASTSLNLFFTDLFVETLSIELVNELGEIVFASKNIATDQLFAIDISGFTNGIYFLKAFSENSVEVKKIIINH